MPLPTIHDPRQLIPYLKRWQRQLAPSVQRAIPPRVPFNFRATSGAVGTTQIVLDWEQVKGADGYEIQYSPSGDFSNAVSISVQNERQVSYVDDIGTTAVLRYYRIRATAGTHDHKQQGKSRWSAPISVTSGAGSTTYDEQSSEDWADPFGWDNYQSGAYYYGGDPNE